VGDDDESKRLVRDATDLGQHFSGQHWRAERVDHDNTAIGHDEACIRDEVSVGRRPQRRRTLEEPNAIADLHGAQARVSSLRTEVQAGQN
jgi:hypothetical protein